MVSINAVPNEIFTEIFTFLNDEDLASASQACRRFQALAEPLRYKHVNLSDRVNQVVDASILPLFLRTILERPVLANYVQSLEIRWEMPDRTSDPNPHTAGDITLFTAAARNVAFMKSLESPGSQVALLLYLLPSIRSLKFFPPGEFDTFAEFMQELTVPRTAALPAGLKSVREITYRCPWSSSASSLVLALLSLPAISKIDVRGGCGSGETEFDLGRFTGRSSVSNLSFGHFILSTFTLTRLVEISTGLTYFSYLDRFGDPTRFDSALFGRALRGSRNTLQYLRLTFANRDRYPYRPDRRGSLGSLQDYPVLRSVWCPLAVLLGRTPRTMTERLVQVLPTVIEELRVGSQAFDPWSNPEVVQQVVEVLEHKKLGGFAKLVKVTLMPRGSGKAEAGRLRAACDAVGVTLVITQNILS